MVWRIGMKWGLPKLSKYANKVDKELYIAVLGILDVEFLNNVNISTFVNIFSNVFYKEKNSN